MDMENENQNLIPLVALQGNEPTQLNPLQQAMASHVQEIVFFWILVWWITGMVIITKFVKEYQRERKNSNV